jgi:hypothetical protein
MTSGRAVGSKTRLILALALFFLAMSGTRAALPADPPEVLFTNLAQRILDTMPGDFAPVESVTRIPVWPVNRYPGALHRVMQQAANICDAMQDDRLPLVFQPVLAAEGTNVIIAGWTNLTSAAGLDGWLDQNVAGVPLVIAAKKGLPCFNEFSSRTDVLVARKLQLVRTSTNPPTPFNIDRTNQMYLLGWSNVFGVEAWNPFSAGYAAASTIRVSNVARVSITSRAGVIFAATNVASTVTNMSNWEGWIGHTTTGPNFQLLLGAAQIALPFSAYSFLSNRFSAVATNAFEGPASTNAPYPLPDWTLVVSNRLVYLLTDDATGRIVDFAVLHDVDAINVGRALLENPELPLMPYGAVWSTNRSRGSNGPTDGMVAQIDICLGQTPLSVVDWNTFGFGVMGLNEKNRAIDLFRTFLGFLPISHPSNVATGMNAVTPFNPIARLAHVRSYQANDPLVHTHIDDLRLWPTNVFSQILRTPKTNLALNLVPMTLGGLNGGFRPWAASERFFNTGETNSFNPALRDPGVVVSGEWEFPTNAPLESGWLGRVHRGTPWQSVYLKSPVASAAAWIAQSRDPSGRNHPTNDWKLAAALSPLLDTNDPAARLSINSTDFAAWTNALAGLVVLSNNVPVSDVNLGRAPGFETNMVTPDAPQLAGLFDAIQRARVARPGQYFADLPAFLAVPELGLGSPWLNTSDWRLLRYGLTDAACEMLPAQLLSRLRTDPVARVTRGTNTVTVRFTGCLDGMHEVQGSVDAEDWIFAAGPLAPVDSVIILQLPAGESARFFRLRRLE